MTYLLDVNVIQENHPGGHANVRAWFAAVDDANLHLSVMSFREIEQGIEKVRKARPAFAAQRNVALAAIKAAYAGRIIPIDEPIAEEWGRLIGSKDKHRDDMAYAATARVRGLILVTRNVADFAGRGVRVLDPFKRNPIIQTV